MSRRATVQPPWLDAMLLSWGRIKVKDALGYPTESIMFKERIPAQTRSYEPTGYSAVDYKELESAIERLDPKFQLVIIRCFKPWTAVAVEHELRSRYAVGDRTWRNWLHEGAAMLAADMQRQEDARRYA